METIKEPQRFILPRISHDKPYVINAEIRFVTNSQHAHFGKVKLYLDMAYDPVECHPDYDRYMDQGDAENLLTGLGFSRVEDGFDVYDISHLKKIKSKLPKEWVNAFNYWYNYAY